MAQKIPFPDFVRDVFANPGGDDNILKEEVRLFIWNLIDKVQTTHKFGQCYVEIKSKHIFVINSIPFITAKTVEFTDGAAISNYTQIHQLLTGSLFQNMVVPNCMNDFLRLLIDNPLGNGYLIARHCSILPTAMHISFVTNLVESWSTLKDPVRSDFYRIIDSVVIEGDWKNNIENDEFFSYQLHRHDYHSSCPSLNTYTLLKFMRDCVEHVGEGKRTKFEGSRFYKKWKTDQGQSSSKPNPMDTHVYRGAKTFNKTQFDLLKIYYEQFPNVLVEIQHALFKNDYLAFLSIHPCDETYYV